MSRRYHVVSRRPQVDQTLFGPSHREAPDPGYRCLQSRIDDVEGTFPPRPVCMQILSKDHIRTLVVPPEDDPSGKSTIVQFSDYERLKKAANVITKEQRQEMAEALEKERQQARLESMERHQKMKMQELQRTKQESLADVEEAEMMKNEMLLRKAEELRQENEDEIKTLNGMILGAKVQLVRDAQVIEKEKIKKDLKVENKRLDRASEFDRLNAVKIEEEIAVKRRNENMVGAMMIMDQIKHHQQDKLLDLQVKDYENKQMKKLVGEMCEEVIAHRDHVTVKKRVMREGLDKGVAENIQKKAHAKELERRLLSDMKKFRTEKDAWEDGIKKATQRVMREKEMERTRLLEQQEQNMGQQEKRDALQAKRAQQQAERDWRRKELFNENKRKADVEHLKSERMKQQLEKQHFLSVAVQRNRGDFERVLRAQQEVIAKSERETDIKHKKSRVFLAGIRQQIRDKEEFRMQERRGKYQEGNRLVEEAKKRKQKLAEAKERKFKEIRKLGVSEKYVQMLDRKITHLKVQ